MATEAVEGQSAPGAVVETNADEFADILKQSFRPRTAQAASDVEHAVATLINEALADTGLIREDVLDTIEDMIARLDRKLSDQVNEIIHDKRFQELEAAWRGLHHLIFNSETDSSLQIKVMNISKTELAGMFKENFKQFEEQVSDEIRAAGPR